MSSIESTAPPGQLSGQPLTIRNIGPLADQLRAQFEQDGPISINVSDDAEVDLSFVQLILAARLEAERSGRSLKLSSAASGSLLSTLERGGILHQASPEEIAFWLHKKDPT